MWNRSAISLRARASTCAALGLLAATLGPLLGCSGGRQMRSDLYTRELRLQEDEIYRLEDCLEDCHRVIRAMRQENHELKQQLAGGASEERGGEDSTKEVEERSLLDEFDWSPNRPQGPSGPTERAEPIDEDAPPGVELPPIDMGQPVEIPPADTPEIELPAPEPPASPPTESPALDQQPEAEKPAFELIPLGDARPELEPTPRLDAQLTSAVDSLERIASAEISYQPGPPEESGEQTLIVLVRPLSEAGTTMLVEGEASLMLRDPESDGPQGVLARWDYNPAEVSGAWRDLEDAPTLDFLLVLPDGAPTDRSLELWIRFVDKRGAKSLLQSEVILGAPSKRPAAEEPNPANAAPSPPTTAWRAKTHADQELESEVRFASFEEAR